MAAAARMGREDRMTGSGWPSHSGSPWRKRNRLISLSLSQKGKILAATKAEMSSDMQWHERRLGRKVKKIMQGRHRGRTRELLLTDSDSVAFAEVAGFGAWGRHGMAGGK